MEALQASIDRTKHDEPEKKKTTRKKAAPKKETSVNRKLSGRRMMSLGFLLVFARNQAFNKGVKGI